MRMPPVRVVEQLDVLEHRLPPCRVTATDFSPDFFLLQVCKETFRDS
jgi:hypothetical protein